MQWQNKISGPGYWVRARRNLHDSKADYTIVVVGGCMTEAYCELPLDDNVLYYGPFLSTGDLPPFPPSDKKVLSAIQSEHPELVAKCRESLEVKSC